MPVVINGTSGITDVDGTAAAPALTGTDTDTGTFFPAANTIAWSTGGTERMRVDSAGNVGIGTSSPIRKLTVAASATPEFVLQETSGAANAKNWRIFNSANKFYIGTLNDAGTAGTDIVTIDSSSIFTFATGGSSITTGGGTPRLSMNFSSNTGAGYAIQDTSPQNVS